MFKEVLQLREGKLGPQHADTLKSMNDLATAYLETSRWPDAEELLRKCLQLREKATPDDWRRFHTMSQLGSSLVALGRNAQAEPLLIAGYEGMKRRETEIPAYRKKDLAAAATRIVAFYEAWGKPEKADAWRQKLASPVDDPPTP